MSSTVETLTTNIQKCNISEKKSKKILTSYWAVDLQKSLIFTIPEISSFLESHKELIPLEKIHSTLLFVGKKENENEQYFFPLEGKECQVIISGYGYSENAIAMEVDNITYLSETGENIKVPTFAIKQHITTALSTGTKPVDSVKTLTGEGTITKFPHVIIVTGRIKRYFF